MAVLVDTWRLLLTALGLAMFLEGLPYFIFPGVVRRYMAEIQQFRDGWLRALGLLLMGLGLLIAYVSLH